MNKYIILQFNNIFISIDFRMVVVAIEQATNPSEEDLEWLDWAKRKAGGLNTIKQK